MEERVRAFNHRTVGQHLSSWLALVLCAAAPALATESPLSFDIAPGPLKAAISRFAAASGLQVLYDSRVVSGQRSGGAVGQLTSAQALQRILATTHIGYRMTGGAVALFRKPPPGNPVVGAVAAGQPAGVGRLKSVTVNGTRWRDGFYATGTSLSSIVVTGSLINRSNADTAEAITIVKADALKNMGISNVEQAIDQISANVPSDINVATSVSAFTGGGSYANLRDLNVGHTLVLLDGYRLADDAFTGNSVDLMGIPYSAIENIQVLRESASSLYGSDAIGGVINFVTRQSYQGAQLDLDLNRPQEAGGGSREASFSFGHGGLARDGYNLMITGSYSEQQELTASQRSFAALGLDPARGLENDNGVLGTFPGSYLDGNLNWWQVGYPSCSGNPHLTRVNGRCDYLYSAAVDLIPKTSVASGLISFIRKLWANDTLRLQYFYTRSKTTAWEGPITYAFNMVPSSPYYPSAAESTCSGGAANCSTSAPDLGGKLYVGWTDPNNDRLSAYTNTEQRILLTLSGQDRGWDYSSGLSYSQNKNVFDIDAGYPDFNLIAPGGLLSNLINPFGPESAAGQALIDGAYRNGRIATGTLKYWAIRGQVSHRLGDAFQSDRPAVLALGLEVHGDRIDFSSTPLARTLYAALGYPPQAISGSRTDQALFAELDVPISKSLDIDISDRDDRYSDFGETNNAKLSSRFQPSHYLIFRASASTGFKAPTLVQLYSPNALYAQAGLMDGPGCASGNYTGVFTYANCNSPGLGLFGGNRSLKPETSENFELGLSIEPRANFGIALDYYRILINNEIQNIPGYAIYSNPAQFSNLYVLNDSGTLTQAASFATDCQPYTSPSCGYVLETLENTGGIATDGFDLSVRYSRRTSVGIFRADLAGTLITHYRLEEYTGGPQVDLLGWYAQGNEPAIRWQHDLRLTWASPGGNWGAGISNHFLSSYIDELAAGPSNSGGQRVVGDQSTWDVYATYEPIHPLTVLFGIRNVLDRNPPFSNQATNWQSGYSPIFSNPLLRTFYLNLKYRLL